MLIATTWQQLHSTEPFHSGVNPDGVSTDHNSLATAPLCRTISPSHRPADADLGSAGRADVTPILQERQLMLQLLLLVSQSADGALQFLHLFLQPADGALELLRLLGRGHWLSLILHAQTVSATTAPTTVRKRGSIQLNQTRGEKLLYQVPEKQEPQNSITTNQTEHSTKESTQKNKPKKTHPTFPYIEYQHQVTAPPPTLSSQYTLSTIMPMARTPKF